MKPERLKGTRCGPPFPMYEDPVTDLLAAHRSVDSERDGTVAHILATYAGYAYSDIETLTTILSRVGLVEHACVRVAQTVDAMFVFSTAYLVQSRCGRVVILGYRGTEPANLGAWLGDADIGFDSLRLGTEVVSVHSGFYRNVRATFITVTDQLKLALEARSLLDPDANVDRPMEALYVTGHSLGGAMALLFALAVAERPEHRAVAERLRAVYTFGQPMALGDPLPDVARAVSRKVFRHVLARDAVPCLPPIGWGRFAHAGLEYRYEDGAWQRQERPVAQLASLRELPRTLLTLIAPASRRKASRYSVADHQPQQYIAALQPRGRVTEYGDRG